VRRRMDRGYRVAPGGSVAYTRSRLRLDSVPIRQRNTVRVNNISCSPFRVPIARLAAAQAAIGDGKERDK
jgi:hypothetical protein